MTKKNLEIFLEAYVENKDPELYINDDSMRKPMGYWKEWSNIENVLRKVIQSAGHFPSKGELSQQGYSSVATAIQEYHDGMKNVRQKMGFKSKRVEADHWSNIENIKNAIAELEKELDHFPSISEIMRNGYSGMVRAITKQHGGYRTIRLLMGGKIIQQSAGHWQKWRNVELVLQELTESLGHFPSETDLRNSQYSTIPNAIRQYYGGMREVRKRMGEKKIKKPNKYWHDFENIRKELAPPILELGKFPTHNQLIERGESSLSSAIRDYHGGFRKVKHRVGRVEEDKYGRYKSKNAVIKKLKEIWNHYPELNNQIPSDYWLRKNGYTYLGQSIVAHHGGYQTFRKKLGKKNKRKPDRYWSDFDNVKIALKKLEKKFGHFPSPDEIRNAGYGGMYSAIHKKYGGIRAVRERILGNLEMNSESQLEEFLKEYVGGEQ